MNDYIPYPEQSDSHTLEDITAIAEYWSKSQGKDVKPSDKPLGVAYVKTKEELVNLVAKEAGCWCRAQAEHLLQYCIHSYAAGKDGEDGTYVICLNSIKCSHDTERNVTHNCKYPTPGWVLHQQCPENYDKYGKWIDPPDERNLFQKIVSVVALAGVVVVSGLLLLAIGEVIVQSAETSVNPSALYIMTVIFLLISLGVGGMAILVCIAIGGWFWLEYHTYTRSFMLGLASFTLFLILVFVISLTL